jgi:chromosome partitioning protein
MTEDYDTDQVILGPGHPKPDLMPSSIDLAGAETELIGPIDGRTRLRNRLAKQLDSQYDFVVIDAPPSLGLLTVNALAAADEVIIPVAPSVFGLQGISKLLDTIEKVQQYLNCPELHLCGVLCTFVENTIVSQDVERVVRDHFGEMAFKTGIPKNVKIEEAHSRASNIFAYAPTSKGAQAYAKFVEEVLQRG